MSWYAPPPDPYAAAYGGYAPPPPPPGQPYYGYQPPLPPPPVQQAYPPHQPHAAYGRYDYAAYAGYAQQAPPPPPPLAPPVAGHYYQHPHHSPAPSGMGSPPPPHLQHQHQQQQSPPLKEGELRPPPDVAHDPNSFRRYLSQQLQGLTFNSKPIITSLTLFAHEHLLRMSSVVAQCLEEHLRTCPPQHVLPAFYLLDSISKNIGAPYLALFARFLERVFLSAYHSADATTRIKLEELLGTWKTGGSDGGELFRGVDEPREGGRVQRGIEGALFGARGKGDGIGGRAVKDADMYHAGVQQLPHTATSTERSGVLYDVRRLLTLRTEQAAAASPSSPGAGLDPTAEANNQSQILALKKLESLILNTQLTTEQVNQIRAQLKALAPAPPPPLPPPSAHSPPPSALSPAAVDPLGSTATREPSASVTPQLAPAQGPSPVAQPPPPALVGGIDLGLLSQLSASGALANLFAPQPNSAPGPGGAGAVEPVKVEDVSYKVEDAGAGHDTKTPLLGGEDAPGVAGPTTGGFEAGVRTERDELAQGWEEEILRLNVGLTNAEVAAPRPQAANLLYLAFALTCAQCGLRFCASPSGKRKMDQHLDWHFKHKRRIREAAGRTAGRGWFTSEEDWYASDAATTGEIAPSVGFSTSGGPNAAAAAAAGAGPGAAGPAIDRAALRKLKVPVPSAAAGGNGATDALGDKPCPVCQDKLKSEWSDEEEEWVWWNAVVVDGVLYHATCHAEATQAQQAHRSAVGTGTGTGTRALPSREGTPIATAVLRKRPAPLDDEGGVTPVQAEAVGAGPVEGGLVSQPVQDEPQLKRVKSEPGLEEEASGN